MAAGTVTFFDTAFPGVKMGVVSASDGDTINTRLGTLKGITMTPTTTGAAANFTSVSGGTVTISLKTHAGAGISSDENIYFIAWGED